MNESDLQRNYRDELLKIVDSVNPIWWQEMDEEEKNTWKEFRQKLLDIPNKEDFPNNIDWPVSPIVQKMLDAEMPPE
jgi:hypothetical protein